MKDISSFDEYQQLALRTLNDKGTDMNLVHCAMGMAGEASELYELVHTNATMTGAVGEIGDCLWYTAVGAHQIGVKFADVVVEARAALGEAPAKDSFDLMIVHGGHFLEDTKKWLFYDKPVDYTDTVTSMVGYTVGLLSMCAAMNCTLEEACFRNINKLAQRYPDKYENERAINRDYKKESEAAGTTIV